MLLIVEFRSSNKKSDKFFINSFIVMFYFINVITVYCIINLELRNGQKIINEFDLKSDENGE